MTPPGRNDPLRPLLVLLLLALPLLAGCLGSDGDGQDGGDGTDGGDGADGGDGNDGGTPRYTNPYDLPLHFDGTAAYQLALEQIYTDPETHSGPRYRIPGTETHTEVALELHAHLEDAMQALGGGASLSRFSGERYYALDLAPVEHHLCAQGAPARERVRDIEFLNIVGRTSATEIGFIIGAHWDSKRHADSDPDSADRDEPVLAADDGAAGTAAVIELARAFGAAGIDIPLTFVLFDGEDGFARDDCHPLAGSLHFAQSLTDAEKETTRGMILLDMIGNASAMFYREANSRSYEAPSGTVRSVWLQDMIWETAAAMEVEAFRDRTLGDGIADDHIPFLYEGIHAVDIIRYENGFAEYWHTTTDDHTAIQPEGIEQVGAVVEMSLRRYAADPDAFQ